MTCLNPELKLEALKRTISDVTLTVLNLKDEKYNKEIENICNKIKDSGKTFEYIEWVKEKSKTAKKTSYFSEKKSCSSSPIEFAVKFKKDFKELKEHATRYRTQFERISEIKTIVAEPTNNAKLLRIDWSENAELYQTRQEKSVYYTQISSSINTGVLYTPNGVQCVSTISDCLDHKAPATWASLSQMLMSADITCTETLYIASDSPTSQYRNKKNIFLAKKWAIDNSIELYWIFTETGHGKGPMDGVGGSIKNMIKDTLAYHPNNVIRNTEQLLKYLPDSNISISTYSEDDVKNISSKMPSPDKFDILSDGVHEIYFSSNDDKTIKWKKLSSDSNYSNARIKVKEQLSQP